MQRGARSLNLGVTVGVPCWLRSGRQKRYKNNAFFDDFPNEGHAGSGHQMYPEEQSLQNKFGK